MMLDVFLGDQYPLLGRHREKKLLRSPTDQANGHSAV
jgi:hypothetical protein